MLDKAERLATRRQRHMSGSEDSLLKILGMKIQGYVEVRSEKSLT